MRPLLIALGAGFGAPARFAIDQYFRKFTSRPIGTFIVNILGSFLIGLTAANSEHIHDLVAIGFAGAFTTWSTYVLDLYLAFELKQYKEVVVNLLASIIFGLLAAYLGLQIAS